MSESSHHYRMPIATVQITKRMKNKNWAIYAVYLYKYSINDRRLEEYTVYVKEKTELRFPSEGTMNDTNVESGG